jgi:hypothetical protein
MKTYLGPYDLCIQEELLSVPTICRRTGTGVSTRLDTIRNISSIKACSPSFGAAGFSLSDSLGVSFQIVDLATF